jgi:cobalamin biosynthesis protein CobD/CbiB
MDHPVELFSAFTHTITNSVAYKTLIAPTHISYYYYKTHLLTAVDQKRQSHYRCSSRGTVAWSRKSLRLLASRETASLKESTVAVAAANSDDDKPYHYSVETSSSTKKKITPVKIDKFFFDT